MGGLHGREPVGAVAGTGLLWHRHLHRRFTALSVLVVVLTIGIAARITRLLTTDQVSYPIRQRIVVQAGIYGF